MTVFWFLLYAQKERHGGEPYRLCLCKRLRAADRRDETIAIVCASNPSVAAAPCHFSLRLGHGAALICHRHIIHYRAATSLPLTQGSLLVDAMPEFGMKGVAGDGDAEPSAASGGCSEAEHP